MTYPCDNPECPICGAGKYYGEAFTMVGIEFAEYNHVEYRYIGIRKYAVLDGTTPCLQNGKMTTLEETNGIVKIKIDAPLFQKKNRTAKIRCKYEFYQQTCGHQEQAMLRKMEREDREKE